MCSGGWWQKTETHRTPFLSNYMKGHTYSGLWTLWKSRSSICFDLKSCTGTTRTLCVPECDCRGQRESHCFPVWMSRAVLDHTVNLVLSPEHRSTNWVLPSSPAPFFTLLPLTLHLTQLILSHVWRVRCAALVSRGSHSSFLDSFSGHYHRESTCWQWC